MHSLVLVSGCLEIYKGAVEKRCGSVDQVFHHTIKGAVGRGMNIVDVARNPDIYIVNNNAFH